MVSSDNTRLMNQMLPEVRTSRMDVEAFDSAKIIESLMRETGINRDAAEKVTTTVLKRIIQSNVQWLSGPQIREMCSSVLAEMGLLEARKRYTRIGMPLMDYEELLTQGIKENANQYDNPESIHSWAADRIAAEYSLLRLLKEDHSKAHLKGDLHVHMLRYFDLRPFCQEWDLRMILKYGLPPCGWRHSAVSTPARHAMVAILHAAKWLGIVQGEFSGGQGYDNFTVFMAPYLRGLSHDDAKQLAQCFLYETNQIYAARGAQVPFTSISCLPTVPESLMEVPAVSLGGKTDGVYGDYVDECNLFFRALSEVYCQGDGTGKLFNFPKHEIKLKKEWLTKFEDEFLLISKEAAKFGLPYYLNMVADWMPDEVHSQCLPYSEPLIAYINGQIKFLPIGKIVTEELQKITQDMSKIKTPLWIQPTNKIDVLSINPITQKVEFQPVTNLLYNPTRSKIITFTTEGGLQMATNEAHPLIVLDPVQQKLIIKKARDICLGDFILKMTKWDTLLESPSDFDLIDILLKRDQIDNFTVYGISKEFLREKDQSELASILEVPKDRIGWWRRSKSVDLKAYLKLERNAADRSQLKLVTKGGRGFINARIKCDINLMSFIGYYLAEGSISERKGIRLSFNPAEEDKIQEVEHLIQTVFGIKTTRRIQVDRVKNYNHCNIEVNSQLLLELIHYWNLGLDARSKQLPDFVFNLSNELTKHLIRSLFLGDGYFRIMENSIEVSLHVTSEKLVEGVQYLLLKHGINSTISRKEDSINLSIERHESMKLFLDMIPEWQMLYDQRKYESKRYVPTISKRYPSVLINKNEIHDRTDKGIVSQAQKGNRMIGMEIIQRLPNKAKSKLLTILMQSDSFNLVRIKKIETTGYAEAFFDVEVGLLGKKGNFVHGNGLITHNCCRIILTPEGIRKVCHDPDLFDWNKSYMNLGSLQSVSLNLPRYAYQAKGDDDTLFEIIDHNMGLAREILIIKQAVIEKAMRNNLIPLCASKLEGVPLLDFRKQTLSIGFVGLNECVLAHIGNELHESNTAYEFGKKVLRHLSKKCDEFTESNLVKFSLWEQPAESTAERFAKLDLIHYPNEAIPLGDRDTNSVYYTNSDHLNYAANIPLFERIERQAEFHPIVQGGVITHIWMGEAYPDPEGLWKFTKAITATPTAYFTFTKDFTQCLKCLKFINGIYNSCPHCGASDEYIEWWSRVTGYYSRVKRFNQGKFQEWHDRKRYDVLSV
ncbi:MAG TPA: anaerobic ribonucleoside-triphosphate reductase [Candidatus Deferrimicrobium sp.]|nr:anaerobic ribonucleoside-triphosphate reductase [Candidatus Deferrimicrobium sp.]